MLLNLNDGDVLRPDVVVNGAQNYPEHHIGKVIVQVELLAVECELFPRKLVIHGVNLPRQLKVVKQEYGWRAQ